ncbi:TerB family tellurite resistance protein [Flavobacterium orientale]|jgi:hypothetical protein|uniref:Co-chaperone DjlA N-terminal domain-containing protein n=1 Tax=Flavobacterium orientale TaxID=1756020 RepID=A0A916Y2Q3_9FLAO|nr:TerB family tellurite resistance protein [Flavobacterium orientale]GGD28306.1 hypothetical protein GCM10011343_18100 [Flavobacterium orientale]
MITYKEKLSLIGDMIELSKVDGKLHEREYEFIKMVADDLKVRDADFDELFKIPNELLVFKSEFKRIEHFYRLALLSHCDNHHHDREHEFLYQLGLKLGLNPFSIKRVLHEMEKSPTRMVEADLLFGIFKEQHN